MDRLLWVVYASLVFQARPGLSHEAPAPAPVPVGIVKRQTAGVTASATKAASPEITAVSGCHFHGTAQYCMVGNSEFSISGVTGTQGAASSYTDCHNHGTQTWCMAETTEVLIVGEDVAETAHTGATAAATTAAATATSSLTAITGCHMHGSSLYCFDGEMEYHVHTTLSGTATTDYPAQFTGCHSHGTDTYCLAPNGDDVEVAAEGAEESEADSSESSDKGGQNCHFHAGVEHCVGSGSEEDSEPQCDRVDRDYKVGLRVGLLFVILATSALGVFGPILMSKFVPANNIVFAILRQFGTGVIISTAFVHLLTHATLLFSNKCLGELKYEATSTSIMMAGLFLSFLVEYLLHKFSHWHDQKAASSALENGVQQSSQMVNIVVFEAGIIFHSVIIGLTLVVSGDSVFITLFIVIIFHQMFEGIALGTRIAAVGTRTASGHELENTASNSTNTQEPKVTETGMSMAKKLILATAFALITPIGMAIGIGVLKKFNGNDPSTIVAIGTLDSLSAGILVWVGVVELWAYDWTNGGEMAVAGPVKTILGLIALIAGMVLMSFLGKWA